MIRLYLAAGLLTLPSIFFALQVHAQEKIKIDAKIAYIVAGMKDARAKIKSFEATTKYYNFEPKEVGAIFKELSPTSQIETSKDLENIREIRYWSDGGIEKWFIHYIHDKFGNYDSARTLWIHPDKAFTLTQENYSGKKEKSPDYHGSIVTLDMVYRDTFSGEARDGDPRRLAYPAGERLFFDDLLNRNEFPAFDRG